MNVRYHAVEFIASLTLYTDISRARQSKVSYEFLQCFRQSSASFSAFLALSAWYYTLEKGIKSPLDSDELEGQALKEVTSNISLSPSGQGCGIIMAVALLANLKECRGENSLAEWHWNGLKQMINIRGGILRLRMYEGLHAYLFWMDTLVCNAVDYPLGQSSSALTGECLLPAGREFVRFHDRIGTNLRAIPVFEDTGAEFSNPIWTILQRPAYIRGKYAYMKWHRARLACVMYLAALTVWKQPEPNNVSVLRMIEDEILLREQSYPLYPEELFHIILRVSNEEYLYLIIYLVSRLMSVTKQLPLRDQSTTYELLSAFLGFSHCPSTVHVTLKEWEQLSSRFPTVLQSSLAQE